jgi:outer membrane protein assembly factor BamA
MRLEANIEYRFPLFWDFEGALFADAGNVWNLRNGSPESLFSFNTFYRQIAADWGAGLRLDLEFVLLRLDLGMKIYDPSYQSWYGPRNWLKKGNYGVQFGVGYPF